MTETDWSAGASSIGLRLAGDEIEEPDVAGRDNHEPSLMLIIHAGPEPIEFPLPNIDRSDTEHTRELILDTDHARGEATARYAEGSEVEIPGRSVWLLQGSPDLRGRRAAIEPRAVRRSANGPLSQTPCVGTVGVMPGVTPRRRSAPAPAAGACVPPAGE